MKKTLKLLLVGIVALCLLSGCYKQDTKISVNPTGSIDIDISMLGNDEAVSEVSGGRSYSDLMDNIMPQIESFKTDDSMTAEQISEEVGGETYQGIRIKAKYGSVSEMANSPFFAAFNASIVTPVVNTDTSEMGYGIQMADKTSPLGTTYTLNGTVALTQGDTVSGDDAAKVAASQVNMTFKFPVLSWGSGKIAAPAYSYSVNADNPKEEVHVWVFVPNFILLLALLIIIALVVVVIVLMSKLSKLSPKGDDSDFDTLATDAEETFSEDDQNFFEGFEENAESEENEEDITEAADSIIDEPEENEDNE